LKLACFSAATIVISLRISKFIRAEAAKLHRLLPPLNALFLWPTSSIEEEDSASQSAQQNRFFDLDLFEPFFELSQQMVRSIFISYVQVFW
jgi:hypothetical protein